MFTKKPSSKPVEIKELSYSHEQAKYLVKEIKRIENLGEVAVLYRNNSSSIELMNEFDKAGIPFYMKDADNRFFSHWVVKDVLNFMRMSFTDKRIDILEKIHMKFNGYISKQQMKELNGFDNNKSVFDNLLNYVTLKEYQVRHIKNSKEIFQEMKRMPPIEAIRVIRTRLGYERALENICERLGFRIDYLIGILNTLEEIAKNLEKLEDFASRLKHLESVLKKAKHRKDENVVTFSTFHSSKGLEFERVYMIDLVKGVIPSKDDQTDVTLMEEATRLFYVGMTRAKKNLELITYRERDGKPTTASEFVVNVKHTLNPPKINPINDFKEEKSTVIFKREIGTKERPDSEPIKKINGVPYNPNAIKKREEIVVGIVVKHRVFGTGKITKVDSDSINIKFPTKEKSLAIVTCLELGLIELV